MRHSQKEAFIRFVDDLLVYWKSRPFPAKKEVNFGVLLCQIVDTWMLQLKRQASYANCNRHPALCSKESVVFFPLYGNKNFIEIKMSLKSVLQVVTRRESSDSRAPNSFEAHYPAYLNDEYRSMTITPFAKKTDSRIKMLDLMVDWLLFETVNWVGFAFTFHLEDKIKYFFLGFHSIWIWT